MVKQLRHPRPTPDQNTGRALRKAAQIIEDRGWLQGSLGSVNDGFCATGALEFAHFGTVDREESYNEGTDLYTYRVRFSNWLHENGYMKPEMVGCFCCSSAADVEDWNDWKDTSKEEVIAVMRKAADELDPQTWI